MNPVENTRPPEPRIRWLDWNHGAVYRVVSAHLEAPAPLSTMEQPPSPPMKQPSPEAVAILAKMMANRHKREAKK